MPILVNQLTAPVATRWATLAQVRARLLSAEVSAGGAGIDALLSSLLDEASATGVRIVGRPVARAQYSQLLPGYGTQQLRLARGPLERLDLTLSLRTVAVDPTLFTVDSRHALLIRVDGGLWELTARYAGRAPATAIPVGGDLSPDYASTFWAGYRMPEQGSGDPGEAFPADLQAVAIRMVAYAYRENLKGGAGVKSMKKADRQIEWYGRPVSDSDMQILEDEKNQVGP